MRILTACFVSLFWFFSSQLFATMADGYVFYTLPSGEFVEREVTLEVPARGEGEVILRGANSEKRSSKFFTVKKNGKTTFYVIFDATSPDGKKVKKIYRGAYIRGTNKAIYYGDIYLKGHRRGHDEGDGDGDNDDWKETAESAGSHYKRFVGGFKFVAEIDQEEE